MADAKRNVEKVERVVVDEVPKGVILTLTDDEAEELFSIVSQTNARNKTMNIYSALVKMYTGDDYGYKRPKHVVSYSNSLIQLKER